ncbi:predicted protein [Chaetomium globosum CBS 148.51]|uniref:Uncharacterized protein n=1 Tax=Chaetomium globosum (strain ATCC 6205 / CBS 148.51 / DSM 1962 / NBRC 6347 / NRRL 1970) TaxID=306901 RepID=Q2GMQ7_CHAGB|nr:uncharacterized protein CHGG_10747 [Chaetomium globosum CBS 148.51]EAQ82929.1 predicted protein [Chaetomium globosum CBS 148.51]
MPQTPQLAEMLQRERRRAVAPQRRSAAFSHATACATVQLCRAPGWFGSPWNERGDLGQDGEIEGGLQAVAC